MKHLRSDNRQLAGDALEKALWLGTMELQRLQAWIPAKKDIDGDGDIDVRL
jgi:hypothetical protein